MLPAENRITVKEETIAVRTFPSLSGPKLAALRREAGMTQDQLAQTAGIGRHTVSRWEQVPSVDPRGWAPQRMFEVLGIRVVPRSRSSTHAGACAHDGVLLPSTRTGVRAHHGVLPWMDQYVAEVMAREEARLAAKREARQARLAVRTKAMRDRLAVREKAAQARRRVPCGARTRKGTPCRMLSVPGRARCKLHGGLSTGPKTADGKASIAEGQRRRWAKYRDRKAQGGAS